MGDSLDSTLPAGLGARFDERDDARETGFAAAAAMRSEKEKMDQEGVDEFCGV